MYPQYYCRSLSRIYIECSLFHLCPLSKSFLEGFLSLAISGHHHGGQNLSLHLAFEQNDSNKSFRVTICEESDLCICDFQCYLL